MNKKQFRPSWLHLLIACLENFLERDIVLRCLLFFSPTWNNRSLQYSQAGKNWLQDWSWGEFQRKASREGDVALIHPADLNLSARQVLYKRVTPLPERHTPRTMSLRLVSPASPRTAGAGVPLLAGILLSDMLRKFVLVICSVCVFSSKTRRC